jgi:hypothetical protein
MEAYRALDDWQTLNSTQDRPTQHAEFIDCIMKSDKSVGEFFDRLDALAYNCGGFDAKIWTMFHCDLIPAVRSSNLYLNQRGRYKT